MRSAVISDRPLYKASSSQQTATSPHCLLCSPSSTSRSPSRSHPRRRQRHFAVEPLPPEIFASTRSTSLPLHVVVALHVTKLGYVESLDPTFHALFFSVWLDLSNLG